MGSTRLFIIAPSYSSGLRPEKLASKLGEAPAASNRAMPSIYDVYDVAAQLFDERFRRSGEEILDLVLSLPSRRRLAATSTPRKAR